MSKIIFVDVGCNDGDTIRQFRNWHHLAYSGYDLEMYGFDPDPRMLELWTERPEKDTLFVNKAAWINDGQIELNMAEDSISSTVMPEKEVEGETVKVDCFDFSEWLKKFRENRVIIKMDIEGAELPILTKMIADGTDHIPTLTMVEWHDGKMPKYESNKDWILKNYSSRLREWR